MQVLSKPASHGRLKLAGVTLVCAWFSIGGMAHFLSTPSFVRIVPPYVPLPLAVVYITGVFELLAAIAVWIPTWRSITGIALLIFTICVTPANIYMSMNPQLFPTISESALTVRLALQVLLLAVIWWSTRDEPLQTSSPRA